MSVTPRRALVAGIAALALASPVAMTTAAAATPPGDKVSTKAPKAPQTKQLLKSISVKDAQLVRLTTADRISGLGDDLEAAVVANIGSDRAVLAALRSEAEATDSTLDTRAARKRLRDFRVVNYVLSSNVLRQAEAIEAESAADPQAATHLADAVAAALAITADSSKSAVRDARDHLRLAKDEIDDDEEVTPAPVV